MKRIKPKTVWLIFVGFSFILLLLPGEVLVSWRLSFFSIVTTAQNYLSGFLNPQAITLEEFRGANDPETELKDSRRRLDEYKKHLFKTQHELSKVRKTLEELAEIKEFLPEVKYTSTRVIYRNYENIDTQDNISGTDIYIDKGNSSGLSAGDAALQGQSVIGIIAKTGANSSLVRLINHPKIIIPGRLQESRVECYVHGTDNGKIEAVFFGNKPDAVVGNIIFTSGLLGNFPENLLIGEIQTLPQLSSDKRSFFCEIKPFAKLDTLENVLVIKRSHKKIPAVGE